MEIARLTRSPEQIYDLRASPSPPLINRRDRLEISERIDHLGEVNVPLDESSVVQAARTLARRGINSVAVCLLHSYLNPSHERAVREIIAREMPGASISISSDVLPSSGSTRDRAPPHSTPISCRSSAEFAPPE